jgi:hypothetical protein
MFDEMQPTKWEIEETILGLADIIMECRHLRRENDELREFKEKYYEEVNQRYRDAEMHSVNMLELAIAMGEKGELK